MNLRAMVSHDFGILACAFLLVAATWLICLSLIRSYRHEKDSQLAHLSFRSKRSRASTVSLHSHIVLLSVNVEWSLRTTRDAFRAFSYGTIKVEIIQCDGRPQFWLCGVRDGDIAHRHDIQKDRFVEHWDPDRLVFMWNRPYAEDDSGLLVHWIYHFERLADFWAFLETFASVAGQSVRQRPWMVRILSTVRLHVSSNIRS